jgi:hypothetical protein
VTEPDVDLVVAVHDPRRPVARAVGSVLGATRAPVRITVVVHNTDPAPIRAALGAHVDDPRVRVRELADGVRSPAGPFNAGLDAATAAFTSVMGSDDALEPGAVDSWLATARRTSADVVIARLRHATGRAVPTPPTRPGRTTGLDGVRDRLSYRSAPLGLVSTARFGALRFATGRAVGEDVPYVSQLWFGGARIAYDRRGPAYLLHEDVEGRTTVSPRPVADELGYLADVLDARWFARLDAAARTAFCVKALRIHVFGAVSNRADPGAWTPADRTALRDAAVAVLAAGDGAERVLSRRDRTLLDTVLAPASPAESMLAAARARRRRLAPGALLPRDLRAALRREAPLRMAAASVLQLR